MAVRLARVIRQIASVFAMLNALIALAMSASPADAAVTRPCARSIAIGLADPNGEFDGMSHSGAYLTVRNRGRRACRLPGLPTVGLFDAGGAPIAAAREAPPFMHPGPVIPAVSLPPGGAAKAELRWVSGDVYEGHNCAAPARVTVTYGAHRVTAPWPGGEICGPAGAALPFTQTALRLGD
jgi:hypothetical protein